jgi:hypothetical protein
LLCEYLKAAKGGVLKDLSRSVGTWLEAAMAGEFQQEKILVLEHTPACEVEQLEERSEVLGRLLEES